MWQEMLQGGGGGESELNGFYHRISASELSSGSWSIELPFTPKIIFVETQTTYNNMKVVRKLDLDANIIYMSDSVSNVWKNVGANDNTIISVIGNKVTYKVLNQYYYTDTDIIIGGE